MNEKGEETPLKAGDYALVNTDEKHQYRNEGNVNVNFTGIINPGDMNEYNSG